MHGNYVDPDSGQIRVGGLGLPTLLLMLVSMSLVFTDHQGDHLLSVREALATALSPLVWVAQTPVRAGLVAERLQSRESLEQENQALQTTLLQLQARLQRLRRGRERLFVEVRGYVSERLQLNGSASLEQLRDGLMTDTPLARIDRRDFERMRRLVQRLARRLAARPARRPRRGSLLFVAVRHTRS